MIYLSFLINAKVFDSSDSYIGVLKDIVVRPTPGEYAPLTYLSIRTKRDGLVWLAYDYVENLSRGKITLKNLYDRIVPIPPENEGLLLRRDVLDQQIVDVEGARVVRVNDLQIGVIDKTMCVVGMDVSTKGMLRRLGAAWLDIFSMFPPKIVDWRNSQVIKGTVHVNSLSKDLVRLHPADIANIIEDLSLKQGSNLVRSLDSATAARVFEEIDPEIQKLLISRLGPEHSAKISERMSIDELVDLLKSLPHHQAKELIEYVEKDRAKKVQTLLRYPDDTAGGLMTTEYISSTPDATVEQAIAKVRKVSDAFRSINYIYVVDALGIYKGVVSLRRLLIAKQTEKLKNIMKKTRRLPVLRPHQSFKIVARIMTKYNLYSIAVVDREKKILGVVTVDDVMRALVPHA